MDGDAPPSAQATETPPLKKRAPKKTAVAKPKAKEPKAAAADSLRAATADAPRTPNEGETVILDPLHASAEPKPVASSESPAKKKRKKAAKSVKAGKPVPLTPAAAEAKSVDPAASSSVESLASENPSSEKAADSVPLPSTTELATRTSPDESLPDVVAGPYLAVDLLDGSARVLESSGPVRIFVEGLTTGMFLPLRRSHGHRFEANDDLARLLPRDDNDDETNDKHESADPHALFETAVANLKAAEQIIYVLVQGLLGGAGLWYVVSAHDVAAICALGTTVNEARRLFFVASRYPLDEMGSTLYDSFVKGALTVHSTVSLIGAMQKGSAFLAEAPRFSWSWRVLLLGGILVCYSLAMALVVAASPLIAQVSVAVNATWCSRGADVSLHGRLVAWKDIAMAYVACILSAWLFTCLEFAVARVHERRRLERAHVLQLQAKEATYAPKMGFIVERSA
ncbi:hypothetical protein, variant [Saprolegnia diclina VS20]|uniref:Transmembrane protein n=1 Tax=Saprolegnia diclina (strain VS20) TaxID=1156394 RepID=T0R413_SAPDV|nr:hypothetical protein, variant [Saprolegnia diclina VS20]EQC41706.1 hypothetical protein, variant [Saprolegnia diclina VS20]|eukprot:XP_008605420.1 hypothetical protein, variant [Saprolegnia diclina VS20]